MPNGVVVIMFLLTGVSRWVCRFNSGIVQFIFHYANQPISTGYAFFQVTRVFNSFLLLFCTIYAQSTHQKQKSTVEHSGVGPLSPLQPLWLTCHI